MATRERRKDTKSSPKTRKVFSEMTEFDARELGVTLRIDDEAIKKFVIMHLTKWAQHLVFQANPHM